MEAVTGAAALVAVEGGPAVAAETVADAIAQGIELARAGRAVGTHLSTPRRHESGYVRRDALVAEAIAKLARPGQVLVSQAAADAARTMPDGITLREVGSRVLEGIGERVTLFQVVAEGLTDATLPVVETASRGGQLPPLLTPTVGRDGELTELSALFDDETVRLVTLTGPGGSGKTRLATALAARLGDQFPDGVHFVPMSTLTRATEMWPAMALVLDVPADGQIPPGFFEYVAGKRVLLVLDNLEQIDGADHVVHDLLASAQHLTVIATSRRSLHVAGEHVHDVPPLELPAQPTYDAIAASGAVQMFVGTAQRAGAELTLSETNAAEVAALCSALDGLPLAIELAAARSRLLRPKALLERLDSALDLSAKDTDRPDRQRTLRNTIDWSFRLLSPTEQHVMGRLGVFAGGASLTALEAVTSPDVVASTEVLGVLDTLLDASLVRVDSATGEPRFSQLETIRRYVADTLIAAAQLTEARQGHAQFFYDYAQQLYDAMAIDQTREEVDLFTREKDNLRKLLDADAPSIADARYPDGVAPPLHVAALLAGLALRARAYADGLSWATMARSQATTVDPIGLAACLNREARAQEVLGHLSESEWLATESIACLDAADTAEADQSPAWVNPVGILSGALHTLGWAQLKHGHPHQAHATVLRLLDLPTGRKERATNLSFLANVETALGDYAGAMRHHAESRQAATELEQWNLVDSAAINASHLALTIGDLPAARRALAAAARSIVDHGDPHAMLNASYNFAFAVGPEFPLVTARAMGAAASFGAAHGFSVTEEDQAEDEKELAEIRPLVSETEWESALEHGRSEQLADILVEMADLPIGGDSG